MRELEPRSQRAQKPVPACESGGWSDHQAPDHGSEALATEGLHPGDRARILCTRKSTGQQGDVAVTRVWVCVRECVRCLDTKTERNRISGKENCSGSTLFMKIKSFCITRRD